MGNSQAIQEEDVTIPEEIIKEEVTIEEEEIIIAETDAEEVDTSKVYKFREIGSGFELDEPQDFYKLRDECLSTGTLFSDPEFPPTHSRYRNIEWKRPADICKQWGKPKLFVDGCTRFDVQQGHLADCWLLAAVSNLTLHKNLRSRVVPDDQGFDEKYAGIFHFRFWQHGRWIDVVVDDRLPTVRGELKYLHSTKKTEFWTALLEKAYAKLHGSYVALNMGISSDAMVDLTGGVCIIHDIPLPYHELKQKQKLEDFLKIIRKAHASGSFMACRLRQPKKTKGHSLSCVRSVQETEQIQGLTPSHAYSITKVDSVTISKTKTHLLRLWNGGIHSMSPEWKGDWSDGSPKWKSVSEEEKRRLGVVNRIDGEFWIPFDDFQRLFERVEVCHLDAALLGAEHVDDDKARKQWHQSQFDGEWCGVSAGGSSYKVENNETFWLNPQYMITLTEADGVEGNECRLIVSLMLKNKIRHKREERIGFDIYCVENTHGAQKPLDLNCFNLEGNQNNKVKPIGESTCSDIREVSCRFKLQPGTYCIIPFTEPKADAEFLLRVFSQNTHTMNYVC